MERYKINFETMPWDTPVVGVRFKAYEQDNRRLRLAEFTREFIEPDWCTKGHIGYVLEGRMEIDFDGEVIAFGPGDGLFIPAGEKHKHKGRVLTDVVKVIFVEDV
jgi:ethanolamine utilization protein EutQ (cupin superfamily)